MAQNILAAFVDLFFFFRFFDFPDKVNHICEQCGKLFNTAQLLSIHMATAHSEQRPHKCDICGLG